MYYRRFTGIWPALITPFRNGEIDHAALRNLVHYFREAEVSGLVVCGTTGEAAAMSESERLAVLDTVIDCDSRLALVMGLAGNNLADVLAELRTILSRPIAGVLMPPPYYVRPSQQGIQDFYTAVADNTSAPLILYNIPYRAGVSIELNTFRKLAQHPMIQGVKDCSGDFALTMQLISDGELDVLAGEDLNIFTTLCLGGSGAIAAASHVRPDLFVQMARLIQMERLDKARALCHALAPMVRDLFSEPNPAPIKALLADAGLIENELRMPMTRASESLTRTLLNHLRNLAAFDQHAENTETSVPRKKNA